MNPDAFIARFRERWQALNQTQKVISVLVTAGILVCLFYLGQVLVRPAYTTLFTGLEPKDAGGIVEKLKTMNISYEIADGGKTIKVPESKVHEVRIQLASEGVLGSGGAGFELFDQNKFGKTEFDQQVDYQRALQEELRRTIVRLEGVEQARVHLVLPQKTVFISEQETSSASVALKLKPLYHLEPGQVRGICDLLVGSVEGLQPENIHIIDTEGNVLSDDLNIGGTDAVLAATALEHQETRREYEKELENRIKQMLTRIIGQNQAVAMVTAELDFDRREVTSSTSSNPDDVKISEHTVTESSEGTEYGGAAGTDSNLTAYPSAEGSGASSYTREESTVNYQVDTRQETVVIAPGRIEKLSAAVVVNNANGPVDVQKVRDVVAAAIGYDQDRGDNIEVTEMAFDDSYQKQVADQLAQTDVRTGETERLYTYAAAGAGALVVFLLLAFMLKRRFSARRIPAAAEEEEKEFIPVRAAEVDQEQIARDETQSKIRNMAKDKPQEVAEILKVWLKE